MIGNFIRTKNQRNFLERPKRKFGIFIGTKNIFNSIKYRYRYRNIYF